MKKTVVRESDSKGWGVFTNFAFQKGEVVVEGKITEELSENSIHACQIGPGRFVLFDEVSQMLNHSCTPNCGIRENETGAHDFVAMRDIAAGEEVTFDYAMQNYTIQHFPNSCICGSSDCRGSISGWKDLPQEKKEEYMPWAAPYLLVEDGRPARA